MRFTELLTILQMAIGPVILISGIGLLLLSMTNRFGRVIDRSRQLADALRDDAQQQDSRVVAQLQILARRAGLLRFAISFATFSVLLAAILVICLFITALLHLDVAMLIATLFIMCLLSLILSLSLFLQDINVSLAALKLDIATADKTESCK
jgi:hypothetical protein